MGGRPTAKRTIALAPCARGPVGHRMVIVRPWVRESIVVVAGETEPLGSVKSTGHTWQDASRFDSASRPGPVVNLGGPRLREMEEQRDISSGTAIV